MSRRPERSANPQVVIKNNLRNIRITQNPRISQWKLALKSNVPQSRISLIENFLINPTEKEKEGLALALNTNILAIFPNGPEQKGETDENVENADK